jgi:hypothetical protein
VLIRAEYPDPVYDTTVYDTAIFQTVSGGVVNIRRASGEDDLLGVPDFLQEYRLHPIRFKPGSVVQLGEEVGEVTETLMMEQSVMVNFDSGIRAVPENYLEGLGSSYTQTHRVCRDYFF